MAFFWVELNRSYWNLNYLQGCRRTFTVKRCIKRGARVEGARRAEMMVTLSRFKSHLKLFQEDVLEKSIWQSAELLTIGIAEEVRN